jgi:hypothetical protein
MVTYARGGGEGEGRGIETTDFVAPEEVFGVFLGTSGVDAGGPTYYA